MAYVKTSVRTFLANAGVGGDKKDIITLFDFDDLAAVNGIVRDGNVVTAVNMAPGKYMIQIICDPKSLKPTSKSTGDFLKAAFEQSVPFDHPGDSLAIRDFRSNWINKKVGIIVEKCSTETKKLYGAVQSPLILVVSGTDDDAATTTGLVFTTLIKGPDVADFTGNYTLETVKGTSAAGATTVDVAAGEGEYQLTTGVAAAAGILSLTNPVDGGTYTLLGSGGAYPSTIASAALMILKNGTAWTAIAGSKITLNAFKDGVATFKFIEVSRS